MASKEAISARLKKLGFKDHGWGRSEVSELPNIILPDEEIYECVNGIYEGGFALLVATDVRVLLVDKKPLKYLSIEDLRFDMINEIDYNRRLLSANISISTGSKNLNFRSYNQPRLRKLINHVQHCMAEAKKQESTHQEGQNQHLEQINQQLQAYLVAQYKQQQKMHEQLQSVHKQVSAQTQTAPKAPEPVKPSPELADYLYAQGLLAQHQLETAQTVPYGFTQQYQALGNASSISPITPTTTPAQPQRDQLSDLYAEGMQEIFGKHNHTQSNGLISHNSINSLQHVGKQVISLEINPLKVAYSKLPTALRIKKFAHPNLHVTKQNSAPIEL
ncbi:MAG: hypothetical protein NVS1B10_05550 [Candidatus Saccharimonadales bacterium]